MSALKWVSVSSFFVFFYFKNFPDCSYSSFPDICPQFTSTSVKRRSILFLYLEHATVNIADADICKVFTSLYMSDLALSVLQKWCKFSSTTTTTGNNLQGFVCTSTWRRRPYLFLVRTPIPQRYRDLTYSYCCPRKCIILRKINGAPSCSFENKFTFFRGSFKCFIDGLRTKEKEQPEPQRLLRNNANRSRHS